MKLKPPSPSELGDRLRESEVWKSMFRPGSIFRKGYKDTSRDRALATMNNVLYHLHPVKIKRHGLKLTYTFCLGGLSFFLFILLGGITVGPNTLLRWYVLHVLALPFVLVIFLAVHFWRIRKDGGISGPL